MTTTYDVVCTGWTPAGPNTWRYTCPACGIVLADADQDSATRAARTHRATHIEGRAL